MLRAARVAVISIHALREEGDRLVPVPRSIFAPISIHALREEGDPAKVCRRCMRSGISIHALREEDDRKKAKATEVEVDFYPRPPRGGRHADNVPGADCANISIHALREEGDTGEIRRKDRPIHFYPRPPRGGRRRQRRPARSGKRISIHALREEGDTLRRCGSSLASRFLSTPSARRATLSSIAKIFRILLFLSTPSARRATGSTRRLTNRPKYFYPRPPRGGRLAPTLNVSAIVNFYPRPPRGGRQQKQRQNLYFLINYTTFCTNLEEL